MSRLEGSLIGGYRLVSSLGSGAMGEVFRATEVATGREVAIKILLSGPKASHAALERFRRERLALAKVHHPHVLTVHAAGSHQGAPYLVTEVVDGGDLAEWLEAQEGRPPLPEASRLLREVAEGLACLHEAGIVHRDLKPANVLLCSPGLSAKVADFGLVVDVESSETLTKTGAMLGTPAYMAPEAMRGDKLRDARADVYSLGVLAYQLLTGSLPHLAPNLILLLVERNETPAPDPRALRPEISPLIASLIMRAMQVDPANRPADASEFVRSLAAAREVNHFSKARLLGGAVLGLLAIVCGIGALLAREASEVSALPPASPEATATASASSGRAPQAQQRVTGVALTELAQVRIMRDRNIRSGLFRDGQLLALVSDEEGQRVELWALEEGKHEFVILEHTRVREKLIANSWSDSGLAVVSESGELRFLSFGGGVLKAALTEASDSPRCAAWQGAELWIGCDSGRLYRWVPGERPRLENEFEAGVRHILQSPRGLHLMIVARGIPRAFSLVRYAQGGIVPSPLKWYSTPTVLIESPGRGSYVGTSAQEVLLWGSGRIEPLRDGIRRQSRLGKRSGFAGIESFPVHGEPVTALALDREVLYSACNAPTSAERAELMAWSHESNQHLGVKRIQQGFISDLVLRPRQGGCDLYSLGANPPLLHIRVDYLHQ